MKTKYWLPGLIIFCLTISVKAQNIDYNNDTIFISNNKIIKCELVALTKDRIYYKVNPDKSIKYILAANTSFVQNNPPQNVEELQNDFIACFDIDGICGFITQSGVYILPAMFENADNFSEGLASVRLNRKWGYIDIYGNWLIRPAYERAESFHNGYARVKYGEKWGVIDKNGQWVIEPDFRRLWDFIQIR